MTEMEARETLGRVSSVQSMGTLDGPGIRYVVFLQGCPLRCSCCHNPETWDFSGGELLSAGEIFDKAVRLRRYFGSKGGITLSGGEAISQPKFSEAVFFLAKREGIHTCLDTSGCILNQDVKNLLSKTDLVLLDIKYTNDEDYRRYAGCSIDAPLSFLAYLQERQIPTRLRQVVISGKNDNEENFCRLAEIARRYTCVSGVELLPFRTLCKTKYEKLGRSFPFTDIPDTPQAQIAELQQKLDAFLAERDI